jgi:CheY-like chemotaxis protein
MSLGTVLYVEPDEVARAATIMDLESAGYFVFAAENTRQALAFLNHRPADFILTDDVLPDGTAEDIARFTREHYSDTRIVVITSNPADCMMGANAVIGRPLMPRDVIDSLKALAKPAADADSE